MDNILKKLRERDREDTDILIQQLRDGNGFLELNEIQNDISIDEQYKSNEKIVFIGEGEDIIYYCNSNECVNLKHELIEEDDGLVCEYCGTAYGHTFDSKAEWRYYGTEDSSGRDPSRTDFSYNQCMPKSCLYTGFSGYWGANSLLYKIQLWQNNDHKEKAIKTKFDEIQKCCSGKIPQGIIEQAKMCFFELSNERANYGKAIVRKDNLTATMASAVYFTCKKNNVVIRFKELEEWFGISEHVIQSIVKNFLKHDIQHEGNIETESIDWKVLLNRYCVLCGFAHLYDETIKFIEKCEELNLTKGKTPQTICAGAIYIIGIIKHGANINKKYITEQCKVSGVTIGRCIISFKKHLGELLFN